MEQFKKLIAALSLKQRMMIVVTAIAVVALISGAVHWKHESDFRPLFTGMAPEDAATIVQKLKESSTEYRLTDSGATVLVPVARVDELRLEMAGAGLPKTGRIGFELFDKSNLGITDFTEHVNYRRALEGELERSIRSLSEVQEARVHVTFPRDSVFLESREPAKASVLVHLRLGAHLSAQNVVAITNLVASAVEGLTPEAVSVLDMTGNLLSRPHKPSIDGGDTSEGALEYRQQVEKDLLGKMNSTLEPLLGEGKFRAGVSVDCDFTSGEQSDEIFDPARSVMVTSQKTEDIVGGAQTSGIPGTGSNLPRPASRPGASGSNVARRTENVTYQSTRMVRHTKLPQGSIKRISASLLLDQDVRWQGRAKVLVPPTPEKLKAIHDLVAGAIGLSTERGDQLVIESLPFEQTLVSEPPLPSAPMPAPPKKWLDTFSIDRRILIGVAVAVLLIVLVPVLLMRKRRPAEAVEVTGQPAIAAPAAVLLTPEQVAAEREQITKAAEESVQQQIKTQTDQKQKFLAEMQDKLRLPPVTTKKVEVLRQHLKESVKTDAALAASVLRGWLEEDGK
ncbi:MAG: flagellar basal-body MS-ring/collar protein FliF [Bryobacteraceae bacterium]|jgi:flagellar M-ring protein FliF